MFERFTGEARSTVVAAQVEAAHRSDTYIGAEHLLVALFDPDGGALADLGTSADDIRRAWRSLEEAALRSVGVIADPGKSGKPFPRHRKRHLPFTGSAKKVLENSLREAVALEDRRIRAEHIALALTSLPGTERAIRILDMAGVDREAFRRALRRRIDPAA